MSFYPEINQVWATILMNLALKMFKISLGEKINSWTTFQSSKIGLWHLRDEFHHFFHEYCELVELNLSTSIFVKIFEHFVNLIVFHLEPKISHGVWEFCKSKRQNGEIVSGNLPSEFISPLWSSSRISNNSLSFAIWSRMYLRFNTFLK